MKVLLAFVVSPSTALTWQSSLEITLYSPYACPATSLFFGPNNIFLSITCILTLLCCFHFFVYFFYCNIFYIFLVHYFLSLYSTLYSELSTFYLFRSFILVFVLFLSLLPSFFSALILILKSKMSLRAVSWQLLPSVGTVDKLDALPCGPEALTAWRWWDRLQSLGNCANTWVLPDKFCAGGDGPPDGDLWLTVQSSLPVMWPARRLVADMNPPSAAEAALPFRLDRGFWRETRTSQKKNRSPVSLFAWSYIILTLCVSFYTYWNM